MVYISDTGSPSVNNRSYMIQDSSVLIQDKKEREWTDDCFALFFMKKADKFLNAIITYSQQENKKILRICSI